MEMKCVRVKCGYEWVSRKDDPKACPKCKGRQDVKENIGN